MICQMCDSKMEIDAVDVFAKINKDIYYICPKCPASCIEHIRLGMSVRELWHYEFNKIVKDWVIEKNDNYYL